MDLSMRPVEPDATGIPGGPSIADASTTLVRRAKALTVHETAYLSCAECDDALAIRGARNEAIVAGLMLAAAPTPSERLFMTKATRLAVFASGLEEPLRSHFADLADAALTAEAAMWIARGSAPPGRRFSAFVEPAAARAPTPRRASTADDLARCAGRAGSGDPDYVLLSSIATIRGLLAQPSQGERAEAGYDAIERGALALCAAIPASRAEREDVRRVALILWTGLRRRRPLAAAILRAKLGLDRTRWGAMHAGV